MPVAVPSSPNTFIRPRAWSRHLLVEEEEVKNRVRGENAVLCFGNSVQLISLWGVARALKRNNSNAYVVW